MNTDIRKLGPVLQCDTFVGFKSQNDQLVPVFYSSDFEGSVLSHLRFRCSYFLSGYVTSCLTQSLVFTILKELNDSYLKIAKVCYAIFLSIILGTMFLCVSIISVTQQKQRFIELNCFLTSFLNPLLQLLEFCFHQFQLYILL